MNQPKKKQILSGWGNCPSANTFSYRPEKEKDLKNILNIKEAIIARGRGRSYGDASLNSNVVLSERLDRFLKFDTNHAIEIFIGL